MVESCILWQTFAYSDMKVPFYGRLCRKVTFCDRSLLEWKKAAFNGRSLHFTTDRSIQWWLVAFSGRCLSLW